MAQNGKSRLEQGLAAYGLAAWCSIKEAARILKMAVATVRAWVLAGKLPGIRIYGGTLHGHLVVRRSAVHAAIAPLGWSTG